MKVSKVKIEEKDMNQIAKMVVDRATGQVESKPKKKTDKNTDNKKRG